MLTNRYRVALLLVVCMLAVVVSGCPPQECPAGANPTRTEGNDEFRRWAAVVSKNGAAVADSCWNPLADDDTLSANADGEAELNFSACWAGRIFIFQDSGGTFQTQKCREADYPGSATCVAFGDWYLGLCAGEFMIHTGSASIEKTGTSLSIAYLPDKLDLTLVVVLEGRVRVTPVDSFGPTVLGPPEIVSAPPSEGTFYFTMPLDRLSPVAGLEPRRVYSVAELPALVDALGIHDWMLKVADKATQDGVLPPTWPKELGGIGEPGRERPERDGYVVTLGGGALEDARVVEGMLLAVDWQAAQSVGAPSGGVVSARTPDGVIDDLSRTPYEPDKAAVLLDRAGYERDQPVTILYPKEDEPLGRTAELLAKYLAGVNVGAVPRAVAGAEMNEMMINLIQAGEMVLSLAR